MQNTIAIIGGGASGLAAGIAALRRAPCRVLLLERQDRVGKKILATGNGRCNLTNTDCSAACYTSGHPQSVQQVLEAVPPARVLTFFARAGLLYDEKESGRIYPHSNQAATVLDILRAEFARLGGTEQCGAHVQEIFRTKSRFSLRLGGGETIQAQRVLLCTGGLAAPHLGCDETGYGLLRTLGHTVRTPYPCLAPLKCNSPYPKMLKGVKVQCTAALLRGETTLAQETGELLFTDYGVSGIPAMQLSHCVHEASARGLTLALDLLPDMLYMELEQYLRQRVRTQAAEPAQTLLTGTVHKKLGLVLLKIANISPTQPCHALSRATIEQLAQTLKHWVLPVTDTLSWAAAQVTGGGALLSEINASTMESYHCKGFYVCGEALDAVGLCGGYNLHWAWATGILAGEAAAGSFLK